MCIVCTYDETTDVSNCIFWNNTRQESTIDIGTRPFGTGDITITNTIVSSNPSSIDEADSTTITTTNVTDTDPLFVDQLTGDLTLQALSPARDIGNNSLFETVLSSVFPDALSLDLNGIDRILNNTIDLGAYEFPAYPRVIVIANQIH